MKVILFIMLLSFSIAAGYVMFVQNDHERSSNYTSEDSEMLELHWNLV